MPNLRQLQVTLAAPKMAFSLFFLHKVNVIQHVSLMLLLMETGPELCPAPFGHAGWLQTGPPAFICEALPSPGLQERLDA